MTQPLTAVPGDPARGGTRRTFRVLLTDEIDREGVELLEAEPALAVDEVPTLPADELLARIGDYDALIGRSATRITAELLRRGTRLRVVGRAGVGVDNIALDAATALGVAVINAPAGNTVAVAELFFGAVLGALRHLPAADASMRAGRWDRSRLLGRELHGRTLGIVGLGRIGTEVARRARAFGMTVLAHDPYVPDERFHAVQAQRVDTLDALLAAADVLTVHTPLNDETRGMIGRRELARLKPGALVVNMARGGIVDEAALLAALAGEGGRELAGAVLDVFTTEPLPADHPLRTAPKVLLTPHLGASTAEGQRNVAVDVCLAVRDALLRDELSRSLNVAAVSGMEWAELQPALLVARRAATLARALLADRGVRVVRRLAVRCGPALAGGSGACLAAAALGVLDGVVETERLNLINARALAEGRGLELAAAASPHLEHPGAVEVTVSGGMEAVTVAGVAAEGLAPRLTQIGSFRVDVAPRQTLLVLTNHDVPGVIGRVGTLLGAAGVNIAEYHQARLAQGGEALAAIAVDGAMDETLRRGLLALPDVLSATVVEFGAA
ncbi:MAG TPA: phosphoglycerate dehydrogenase [Gemmatimonadales bacterium]|nr:phosphoglycerate dehydrogenase [Gemmatimonadales bacterium]